MSVNSSAPSVLIKPSNRKLPGYEKKTEGSWKGQFTFIQAADTQPGMQATFIEKKSENISWDWEIELAKKAILKVNAIKPRPKFMIVCGDIVDAMPGNPDRPQQVKDIFKAFSLLCPDISLICLCGNHDVGNIPTRESVKAYTDDFGDDYFKFWAGGVKCLVLNSQFYEDSSGCPELKVAQDSWLTAELDVAENKEAKHLLVFQHIPWFLQKSDEAKEYFNIEPKLRLEMLDKFANAGVRTIFCGHYHRNAGGFHGNMELVVTSAIGCQLGSDDHGFRIVKVTEKEVTHKYHALKDLPDA